MLAAFHSWPTARVESIGAYSPHAGMLQWHRRYFLVSRADVQFATPSDKEIPARLFAGLRKWPCALTVAPPDTCVRLRTVCRGSPKRKMSCGDLPCCLLRSPLHSMSHAPAVKGNPWSLGSWNEDRRRPDQCSSSRKPCRVTVPRPEFQPGRCRAARSPPYTAYSVSMPWLHWSALLRPARGDCATSRGRRSLCRRRRLRGIFFAP